MITGELASVHAHMRPAGRHRLVDKAQQLELGLRAHALADRAEKRRPCTFRGWGERGSRGSAPAAGGQASASVAGKVRVALYALDRSRLKSDEGQQIWTEWAIRAYNTDTLAVRTR